MEINKRRSLIISSFIVSLIIIIGLFIARRYLVTFKMSGISMQPAFSEGDILLVHKTKDIKAGDIIVYTTKDSEGYIIKRVIAVPNQTVSIEDDDIIYIDGDIYESDYIYIDTENESYAGGMSYQLSDNEYFTLGDNLHHSIDSRTMGAVSSDRIVGKVVFNFAEIIKSFKK